MASCEARHAPGAISYAQGMILEMKSWVHKALISHCPFIYFYLVLGPYSPLHL